MGVVVEALSKMAWNIDATRNTLVLKPITSSIEPDKVDITIKRWTEEINEAVAEL